MELMFTVMLFKVSILTPSIVVPTSLVWRRLMDGNSKA